MRGGQVVEMHGQCSCIMIIRTCNEELIKEAIRLGPMSHTVRAIN